MDLLFYYFGDSVIRILATELVSDIASLFLLGATGGLVSLAAQKYTFIQYSTVPIILGTLIVGIGFIFFSVNAEKVFSAK
jgi:VIT1/CCC1 family predicted Fe2+/Mn2+ transporter